MDRSRAEVILAAAHRRLRAGELTSAQKEISAAWQSLLEHIVTIEDMELLNRTGRMTHAIQVYLAEQVELSEASELLVGELDKEIESATNDAISEGFSPN